MTFRSPFDMGTAEGHEALHTFSAVAERFRHYCDFGAKGFSDRHHELACEAGNRLQQLRRLLEIILELMMESAEISRRTAPPIDGRTVTLNERVAQWNAKLNSSPFKELSDRSVAIGFDLQLLTESFYWIGGRARTAIRLLPGFGNFESDGMRNVRNQLLEHPEKPDSGILITSFGWGGDGGPVVKGPRIAHQAHLWEDKGLFINVNEFSSKLDALLSRQSTTA